MKEIYCFNIMKFSHLQLYLLIWCRAAETLTDQLDDLGQNVTINCDLDVNEVIWLLLKLDSPVLILRTFASTPPFYFKKTFKQKYSVQSKHNLFINNVTIDDLGVYYCMKIDPPQKYSSGTRLKIIGPTAESKNPTVEECIEQNQTQWQIIIIISALLNGLLIIVTTGLLKVFVFGSKRTRDNLKQSQDTNLQQPHVMDLEQQQAPTQVQYATVDFPTSCQRFNPSQVNSTYELLQFPKSWTPKHNHI
uniref:Immunoglobulin domain-containing protein n=1 Tax=Cyprinus carpio TaxID=7962 RepID=A0A8C2Q1Y4_CYPCA